MAGSEQPDRLGLDLSSLYDETRVADALMRDGCPALAVQEAEETAIHLVAHVPEETMNVLD